MDLSKTTALHDVEVNKALKLMTENKKQDILYTHDSSAGDTNCKLVKEKIDNCELSNDFNMFSYCGDVQSNTGHLNYKHLKSSNIQNSQIKNDNAEERNIAISANLNVLPNPKINQNSKIEAISNSEGEFNGISLLNSKLNSCDKKVLGNELKNENIFKSSEESVFAEKIDKSVEKETIKKVDVADDVETIEKIAEMIATNKDTDDKNVKTRKRLQILMARNQHLESLTGSANGGYNAPNASPLQINEDDNKNKKRKYVPEKKLQDSQAGTPKIENKKVEVFEEIEHKLEEMFAGIEDEQLESKTLDDKNISKKSNDSLDKYSKVDCTNFNADYVKESLIDDDLKYDKFILNKSTLSTKAAKKSTPSLPRTENTKQLNVLLKTMSPRKVLPIGINKEHSAKNINEAVTKNAINNVMVKDGRTSTPLTLQADRKVKQIRENVRKNKIKNNNQRTCPKYKKELSYIKSNNYCNKKTVRKSETAFDAKQNRQKLNHSRMQRLLISENGTEEKQLQTREIETKNRSPFILIKHNGSISVVNALAPDDNNEKLTKSKKPSNYVWERKNAKGCHSSTLSNRYDADTADSSWKCVFCKIGPHKHGLGDLFGPYIISNDCDEYRSIKEYFQKLRRNNAQLLNFSNKSVNFVNDTSNSHLQSISECNYEHLINIYALGMSQVSADSYEVWVHEECAVWAPNIFVVGSRLSGLEEAAWNSIRYECVYCLKQGALLCCLQRDCKATSHIPCAREFKWLLNESKFWVYCSKHALH